MSEKRVLLDCAAFLDSPGSRIDGVEVESVRTIVQRFLAACYQDLGKAPRLLDGEDVATILAEMLPRRFAAADPLAGVTERVLDRYLQFVEETEVVVHKFEQRRALLDFAPEFVTKVESGGAHADGMLAGKGKTIRSRGDKVGRNDKCPCGSGKKFKKCCGRNA